MNASTGMRKPPIAPKPKLLQSQKLVIPPLIAQRDGLVQQTPDSPARVKPVLAPKPCLSKLTAAGGRSPVTPKSLYHSSPAVTTKTVGILNSKNGLQQENKRPNWDYIIPICLCSNPNCMCIRSTHSAHIDKTVKDLKADKTGDLTKTSGRDDGDRKTNAKSHVENTTSTRSHTTNLDPKLKTNIDTSSGVHFSPSAPEEDAFIPDTVSEPKMASRASKKPVPSPRTLKKTSLTRQEKVVDEEEEMTGQSGGQKEEETVSPQDNERVCSSVRLSAFLPAKKSCLPPAPPPKKKLFLSTSEQTPASAISAVSSDVVEEDLGWDSSLYEMEVSVDKDEELSTEGKEEKNGYGDLGCSSGGLPDLNVAQTRPQRRSSPMAWTQQTKETYPRGRGGEKTEQDCVFKERVMRELPLPPCEKPRGREDAGTSQRSRSGFGKQRPKSFSGADLTPLGGQRTNSFRKLLDLKLSVLQRFRGKGVPEFPVTHSTGPVRPCSYPEQLRPERKYSCPLIGVEQSVDGDEFPFSTEDDYENMPLYEEIQDYVNMPVGMEVTSPLTSPLTSAWPRRTYDDDDEGIYEEQEPYMSLQKTTAHQHGDETCDSNSKPAELAVGHEGPSDDDTIDQTSDEGDDSSSVSSKGETEQIVTPNRPKKSKIQHIATEIMTSERVFVDVLKLLHIDFRDAVSKASQQSGKPVIEDRLLNQILYSLPQLYELNQDLLRELQIRVAKWDENSQLADIFLKKGPYLKMYSTYVREFDKNVALLEEQTKKNPAFGAAVRGFEASPRCANLALRHYLLKPVQRIPQYQLLLTDYLKNLPEDSVDYKDTEAALHIVKEVANHANDIMKQGDNFQKMIQVQCRLTGHHEIIQPGRLFLKEGTLKKLSRKVMQPRMFFLFNDTLLYTTPVQSGQYKLNNMLSLAGMKVSKPSQEAYQNELNIESVERSFILSASSATERDEWLEAISTAISEYTKKKITFISGKISEQMEFKESGDGYNLGSKAPIWIPDPRATMCMICTCEFTLTWRRHHCRGCGKVVCQSCSSNKHCLEYLKNQLARVCDQCFLVLRQQKSEASESASLSPNKAGFSFRKQKKIPAALKEVTANTDNSSISGYLLRSKGNKKNWKRLWFVIKNKVLYTYAASEDVAALESQPLLGFRLKEDSAQQLQFSLYHKNTLYYTFKADEIQVAQRWIEAFRESTVL